MALPLEYSQCTLDYQLLCGPPGAEGHLDAWWYRPVGGVFLSDGESTVFADVDYVNTSEHVLSHQLEKFCSYHEKGQEGRTLKQLKARDKEIEQRNDISIAGPDGLRTGRGRPNPVYDDKPDRKKRPRNVPKNKALVQRRRELSRRRTPLVATSPLLNTSTIDDWIWSRVTIKY